MSSSWSLGCGILTVLCVLLAGCHRRGHGSPAPATSVANATARGVAHADEAEGDEPAEHEEGDEALEEEALEEKELVEEQLWRVGVMVVGHGRVSTAPQSPEAQSIDCARDAHGQHGECGPKLLRYRQMTPALLTARGATGWKFSHWETRLRLPNAKIVPGRKIPEPFHRLYINGFPAGDTGETELLTAVFTQQANRAFVDGAVPGSPVPAVAAASTTP